jgi:hypothetical protein
MRHHSRVEEKSARWAVAVADLRIYYVTPHPTTPPAYSGGWQEAASFCFKYPISVRVSDTRISLD